MEQLGGYLQQLIDLVKNLAPQLWEIALRQVYAEVVQRGIWSAVLLAGIIFLLVLLPRTRRAFDSAKKDDEGLYVFAMFIECVVLLVTFFAIVAQIQEISARLINPGYYAIQILLNIAK